MTTLHRATNADGQVHESKLWSKSSLARWVAIFIFATLLVVGVGSKNGDDRRSDGDLASGKSALEEKVIPAEGIEMPVRWGNLGREMVEAGVIDSDKLESLYSQRSGMTEEEKALLYGEGNGNLRITPQNSGFLLNMLWALGLANENRILEEGPMQDERYGGAQGFASTGGWTLSTGNAMDHYSAHSFITLSSSEQEMVERVAGNIYRPCCGNSTYFPDCNHGMAMLGLLELMASQGVGEEQMYEVALQVNSYWFPDTYLTLATYFKGRGVPWEDVGPKDVLGSAYSSASGYGAIRAEVEPIQSGGGGGACGV
jgi:hypothetical protein